MIEKRLKLYNVTVVNSALNQIQCRLLLDVAITPAATTPPTTTVSAVTYETPPAPTYQNRSVVTHSAPQTTKVSTAYRAISVAEPSLLDLTKFVNLNDMKLDQCILDGDSLNEDSINISFSDAVIYKFIYEI